MPSIFLVLLLQNTSSLFFLPLLYLLPLLFFLPRSFVQNLYHIFAKFHSFHFPQPKTATVRINQKCWFKIAIKPLKIKTNSLNNKIWPKKLKFASIELASFVLNNFIESKVKRVHHYIPLHKCMRIYHKNVHMSDSSFVFISIKCTK